MKFQRHDAAESTITGQGFPRFVTDGFLDTADAAASIVLTRVPGPATTNLIEARHELKGYKIKAKSCDWGPMAGFVCELPPFNKAGASKMKQNRKENEKYDSGLFASARDAGPPYLPLRITDAAKDAALTESRARYKAFGDDFIVGLVSDRFRTVLAEVLLVRENRPTAPGWLVFHSDVSVNPTRIRGQFSAYDYDTEWYRPRNLRWGDDDEPDLIPKLDPWKDWLNVQHTELARRSSLGLDTSSIKPFRPINGVRNPHPSYVGDMSYKNAVSGDYDLFAVWPLASSGRSTMAELRRYIEREPTETPPDPQAARKRSACHVEPSKKFAVSMDRGLADGKILVDVVPGVLEITPLEDHTVGNWNSLVLLVAGLLNSAVALKHENAVRSVTSIRQSPPNVAFHSDEGGRPAVYELDLPVVAFLPSPMVTREWLRRPRAEPEDGTRSWSVEALPWASEQRIVLIEDVSDFVELIEYLLPYATIVLNHGWLAHMLALCHDPVKPNDVREMQDDAQAFFANREHDVTTLTAETIGELRTKLKDLLLPVPSLDLTAIVGTDTRTGKTESQRQAAAFARHAALVQQQGRLFDRLVDEFHLVTRAALGESFERLEDPRVPRAADVVRRLLAIVDDPPTTTTRT